MKYFASFPTLLSKQFYRNQAKTATFTLPKIEERITFWHFEESAESYLQITDDKSGLKSKTLRLNLVDLYLSKFSVGYFKIPFMIAPIFGSKTCFKKITQ